MRNIKISVIIPVYNEEKLLAKCLQALADQTVKPYEIIVVDNNSTDKSIDIAENFDVKAINETMQGISYARTKGFDTASGNILARIDADSKVSYDWIERIRDCLLKHPDIVGIAGSTGISELSPSKHVYFRWSSWLRRKLQMLMLPTNTNIMYGHNMVLKKSIWLKVRSHVQTDESLYHEDLDISFEAAKYGKIIYAHAVSVAIPLVRFMSLKKNLVYLRKDKNTLHKHRPIK